MCQAGTISNVQKTGLQKREYTKVTLRMSFQTAVQVLQSAAIYGLVDRISGISGPLMVGTNPHIGTTYNRIIVNEDFIKENAKNFTNVIDEL